MVMIGPRGNVRSAPPPPQDDDSQDEHHTRHDGNRNTSGGRSFVNAFRESLRDSLRDFPIDDPSHNSNLLDIATNLAAATADDRSHRDRSHHSGLKGDKKQRGKSGSSFSRTQHDSSYQSSTKQQRAFGSGSREFSAAGAVAAEKEIGVGQAGKGSSAVMTVRVSRVAPRSGKRVKQIYPFSPLEKRALAYRGYPTDGGQSMKDGGQWKVQLVPAEVATPKEPLPAFPELSCLRMAKSGKYRSVKVPLLSSLERDFNSGNAWIAQKGRRDHPSAPIPPVSEFLYAATAPTYANGSLKGAPVGLRIDKSGRLESIYDQAISGKFDMSSNSPAARPTPLSKFSRNTDGGKDAKGSSHTRSQHSSQSYSSPLDEDSADAL